MLIYALMLMMTFKISINNSSAYFDKKRVLNWIYNRFLKQTKQLQP